MALGLDWLRGGSASISPTALYTGHVWSANGLSDPALSSPLSRMVHSVGHLAQAPLEASGAPTLTQVLLARHRLIDHLLAEGIESGRVGQVVELAAGFSPRGLRFTGRYLQLPYVEVDLPAVTSAKRRALSRVEGRSPLLRTESADVFGAGLEPILASLDTSRGIAVITEGLLNYFPTDRVLELWRVVTSSTQDFPSLLYLSDLHLAEHPALGDRLLAAAIGVFVRGRVHFHFESQLAAESALVDCGFDTAALRLPSSYAGALPDMDRPGSDRVRVVEASRTSGRGPTGR